VQTVQVDKSQKDEPGVQETTVPVVIDGQTVQVKTYVLPLLQDDLDPSVKENVHSVKILVPVWAEEEYKTGEQNEDGSDTIAVRPYLKMEPRVVDLGPDSLKKLQEALEPFKAVSRSRNRRSAGDRVRRLRQLRPPHLPNNHRRCQAPTHWWGLSACVRAILPYHVSLQRKGEGMSETRKVAIYHQTQTPDFQPDDLHKISMALGYAQAKGWIVTAIYPDTPKGSIWPLVVKDHRVDGDFDTLLVPTEKSFEPLVYHSMPQDPDEALKCGAADKPLPEPPCGLDRPCPVHSEAKA
jgi:hypothetical protein